MKYKSRMSEIAWPKLWFDEQNVISRQAQMKCHDCNHKQQDMIASTCVCKPGNHHNDLSTLSTTVLYREWWDNIEQNLNGTYC